MRAPWECGKCGVGRSIDHELRARANVRIAGWAAGDALASENTPRQGFTPRRQNANQAYSSRVSLSLASRPKPS